METSLKTDLPQSIRYNPYNINSKPISLGTIGKTSWSLLPKWANCKLSFLQVSRSDDQGRFKIEATFYIIPQGYSQTRSTFIKYIDDGQTIVRLETMWTISFTQYEEIKGNISISKCEMEEKPIAFTGLLQLSEDFLGLLNNPDSFPDATLMCGSAKMSVHKCILSARSPVFAAMFKNQMQEGLSSIVQIEDLEENVLKTMLKYMYSGKTAHIMFGGDLLFAADKYQLSELKSICIGKLKSSMTEQNAIRILLLGHLHDNALKDSAMEFICRCNRFSELEITEHWKLLKTHHKDLAIEVLTSLVKYLQRS